MLTRAAVSSAAAASTGLHVQQSAKQLRLKDRCDSCSRSNVIEQDLRKLRGSMCTHISGYLNISGSEGRHVGESPPKGHRY